MATNDASQRTGQISISTSVGASTDTDPTYLLLPAGGVSGNFESVISELSYL